MARFLPVPVRQAVFRAHLEGLGTADLASHFQLPPRTVRHLVRQGHQGDGAFAAAHYRSGSTASAFPPTVRQQVLGLRQEHPRWGAGVLRAWLLEQGGDDPLPSAATIRRWLRADGLPPARAGRKARARPRAAAPHEVWQVDAADQMPLSNGQLVSWLRLVDECSGAVLQTVAFPSVWNKVAPEATRQTFRQAFARWGLPGRLRLDNGFPWGSFSELPTALALWLAGLGLGLTFNRPRHPRENGVVERSHQTAQAWAEPERCASAAELQRRLDAMDRIQRERYPRVCGLTRWELYPALRRARRPYSEPWEQQNWSLEAARHYLGKRVAQRTVSSQGQVKVYDHAYYVGRLHKGQQAFVQYNAAANQWHFADAKGCEWCHRPAEQMSQERILALAISA